MPDTPLLDADDVRMLVDLGFMALTAGKPKQAAILFEGAKAARPDGEAGPLGLALVHMAEGELDVAAAILKALPPSDAALTYLGMALARQGDAAGARRHLQDVVNTGADTPFGALAEAELQALQS